MSPGMVGFHRGTNSLDLGFHRNRLQENEHRLSFMDDPQGLCVYVRYVAWGAIIHGKRDGNGEEPPRQIPVASANPAAAAISCSPFPPWGQTNCSLNSHFKKACLKPTIQPIDLQQDNWPENKMMVLTQLLSRMHIQPSICPQLWCLKPTQETAPWPWWWLPVQETGMRPGDNYREVTATMMAREKHWKHAGKGSGKVQVLHFVIVRQGVVFLSEDSGPQTLV